MSDRKRYAKQAADALACLNAYHSIIALCEGGLFPSQKATLPTQRIVRICKKEAHRLLIEYDGALEKLEKAA